MAIYDILNEIQDARKEGILCDFNGYLEDYLGRLEENHPDYTVLNTLFELDNDLKIINNLKVSISNTSVSNNIIRYKDIKKVGEHPIVVKYLLYTNKPEGSKAIILEDNYILAKAMYYVLTENPSEFNEYRKDILVCSFENSLADIKNLFSSMYKTKGIILQNNIENVLYPNYDKAYEAALKMSEELEKETLEKVATNKKNRSVIINASVAKWFLLKKFAYVQYMIDRNILNTVHGDNVKEQRNQAKRNSDKIRFVPFCELWKVNKNTNE